MLKVPSYSFLGKTGPLITDAIGLIQVHVYTQNTHMDTSTDTITQAYMFTLTHTERAQVT